MKSAWTVRTAAWTGGILFLLAGPLLASALPLQEEATLPRSLQDKEPERAQDKKPPETAQERRQELEARPDETSFYPIPAIASGKNEGWTYGLLGALLIPDEHGDINKVVSFALQYRSKVKLNGFADFRVSPSATAVFEAYSYWAQKVENENQVFFED